jgi:hypothetical protein
VNTRKSRVVLHNWVAKSRMTELTNFKASLEQLQCKCHRRPPKLGREAYFVIGAILAHFGGL